MTIQRTRRQLTYLMSPNQRRGEYRLSLFSLLSPVKHFLIWKTKPIQFTQYWKFLFLKCKCLFNKPCGVNIITQRLVFLEFQPKIFTRTRPTWNLQTLPQVYANKYKFSVNNTLMSKIFVGRNFRYRNWKCFKWQELVFTLEYCSFFLKSLSLSVTFNVPKNTIIWTMNQPRIHLALTLSL